MSNFGNNICIIAKREFAGYFATPLALVFIVIFLALTGAFAFYVGGFFSRGNADLTAPGPIGSVTPSTGAFTTLTASSTTVTIAAAVGD